MPLLGSPRPFWPMCRKMSSRGLLTPVLPRNDKLISQILCDWPALPWTNWTGDRIHESLEAGRGWDVPNRRDCELRQFLRQVNHSMRLYRLNLLLSTIRPLSHLFCRTAGPGATEGFPLDFGMLALFRRDFATLPAILFGAPLKFLTCQSLLHATWKEKENYTFEPASQGKLVEEL